MLIQPIADTGVLILGADKPRPLTGSDFGWLEAVADRLAVALSNASAVAERENYKNV